MKLTSFGITDGTYEMGPKDELDHLRLVMHMHCGSGGESSVEARKLYGAVYYN